LLIVAAPSIFDNEQQPNLLDQAKRILAMT